MASRLTSRHKVAHTLAAYPREVRLQRIHWLRGAELVGALAALAVGIGMAFPGLPGSTATSSLDHVALGLVLAAIAGATMMVALRDLRRVHSITLTPNGFRIAHGDHHVEHRWTDVQHFREVGDDDHFAVGFDLVLRDAPEGTRADFYFRLRDHYGLRGTDLLSLLTQWHAKALSTR